MIECCYRKRKSIYVLVYDLHCVSVLFMLFSCFHVVTTLHSLLVCGRIEVVEAEVPAAMQELVNQKKAELIGWLVDRVGSY